jgi:hypothetical protein
MMTIPPCSFPPDPAPTPTVARDAEDGLRERALQALDGRGPIPVFPGVEPFDDDDSDGWYAPILDEPIPDADPIDS